MCEAKPGPRCSNHSGEALAAATAELHRKIASNPGDLRAISAAVDSVRIAQMDVDGSRAGQEAIDQAVATAELSARDGNRRRRDAQRLRDARAEQVALMPPATPGTNSGRSVVATHREKIAYETALAASARDDGDEATAARHDANVASYQAMVTQVSAEWQLPVGGHIPTHCPTCGRFVAEEGHQCDIPTAREAVTAWAAAVTSGRPEAHLVAGAIYSTAVWRERLATNGDPQAAEKLALADSYMVAHGQRTCPICNAWVPARRRHACPDAVNTRDGHPVGFARQTESGTWQAMWPDGSPSPAVFADRAQAERFLTQLAPVGPDGRHLRDPASTSGYVTASNARRGMPVMVLGGGSYSAGIVTGRLFGEDGRAEGVTVRTKGALGTQEWPIYDTEWEDGSTYLVFNDDVSPRDAMVSWVLADDANAARQ